MTPFLIIALVLIATLAGFTDGEWTVAVFLLIIAALLCLSL